MEPNTEGTDNPLAPEPAQPTPTPTEQPEVPAPEAPATMAPEVTSAPAEASAPEKPAEAAPNVSETPAEPTVTPAAPEATSSENGAVMSGAVEGVPVAGKSKRHLPKAALVVVGALVLLGGAASAAYYGYVVPNKPENVLKTAFENTLAQRNVSSVTSFETSPTSSDGGLAVKVDAKTSANLDSKAADVNLNLTMTGISLPLELRLVDQNLYVKAGDLSTISSLVESFAPGAGGAVKSVAGSLSNKWIEVDSTLLKQAGATCALDTSWALNKSDVSLLETMYQTNQFITIKSHATDSVNGKAAEKYELAMNDNKFAGYAKNLSQLSVLKDMQKCGSSKYKQPDTSSLADGDTTPITVWVDKSTKRIVKLSTHSTAQDNTKSHFQGTLTSTLSYDPVTVTAPTGAEPALQVITDLEKKLSTDPQLQSLLGGTSLQSL
ncbi:MAG TPA: hypothetical protein VFI84_03425 [Candidatus Saccharimonadales bacterium]|nr:hypothetical protein [Candidatus Saccharimonadales bacterium]